MFVVDRLYVCGFQELWLSLQDPGLDTRGYAILDVLLAWTQACSGSFLKSSLHFQFRLVALNGLLQNMTVVWNDHTFGLQAVCSTLGAVKVNNFNTCFADGQVLCYLVSYYLPSHLPHQAMLPTVNQTLHIVVASLTHNAMDLCYNTTWHCSPNTWCRQYQINFENMFSENINHMCKYTRCERGGHESCICW